MRGKYMSRKTTITRPILSEPYEKNDLAPSPPDSMERQKKDHSYHSRSKTSTNFNYCNPNNFIRLQQRLQQLHLSCALQTYQPITVLMRVCRFIFFNNFRANYSIRFRPTANFSFQSECTDKGASDYFVNPSFRPLVSRTAIERKFFCTNEDDLRNHIKNAIDNNVQDQQDMIQVFIGSMQRNV